MRCTTNIARTHHCLLSVHDDQKRPIKNLKTSISVKKLPKMPLRCTLKRPDQGLLCLRKSHQPFPTAIISHRLIPPVPPPSPRIRRYAYTPTQHTHSPHTSTHVHTPTPTSRHTHNYICVFIWQTQQHTPAVRQTPPRSRPHRHNTPITTAWKPHRSQQRNHSSRISGCKRQCCSLAC